jgi:hypothetical protein
MFWFEPYHACQPTDWLYIDHSLILLLEIMADELAEYESQLAGIEELLAASPGDESLLVLKTDLEELLQLTRANLGTSSSRTNDDADDDGDDDDDFDDQPQESSSAPEAAAAIHTAAGVMNQAVPAGTAATASATEAPLKKNKKKTKLKEFVVPPHLMAKETDSDPEKNRKNRALKKLKNKWRHEKKEVESNNKQKSWQSFQKKASNKRDNSGSIFSTKEGVNDRVGVISKKQMTDFSARKRHKQV